MLLISQVSHFKIDAAKLQIGRSEPDVDVGFFLRPLLCKSMRQKKGDVSY